MRRAKWRPNEAGKQPPRTSGKRVKVRLRNGMEPPSAWPADGKGGCRWSLPGGPFDIVEYQLAGEG